MSPRLNDQPRDAESPETRCAFEGCHGERLRREYCKAHYKQSKKGRPMFPVGSFVRAEPAIQPTPPDVRFWRHVDKSGECWPWNAARNAKGYGEFKWSTSVRVLAHRASWELSFGPVPSEMHVLHRCDNPPCVRPGHLFLGTQADNVADMMSKGRGRNAATASRDDRPGDSQREPEPAY